MKLLCATTAAAALLVTVHAAAAHNVQYAPYLLFSNHNEPAVASCTAEELTMVMDTLQAAIPGTGLAPQAWVDNVQFCSSFAQGSYCEEPTETTAPKDTSSLRASVVARGLAFVNPYCIFSGTGKCSVKKFNAVAPPALPAASALPAALPNTNATTASAATNITTPAAANASNNRTGGRLLAMTFDQLCKFGGTGKCSVKKFNAVAPPPLSSLPLAALNGTTLTNATTILATSNATTVNRTLHAAAQEATPPLHNHGRGRALNGNGPWCKWMGIGCTGPNYEKGTNNITLRHLTVVGDNDHTLCDAEFAALDAALLQLLPEVSSSCQSLLQAPRVQHCVRLVV
jgi:hypothetical protein